MAADTTTTSNMSLVLPVVGVRAGPTYASDWNTAFTTLDAHDHSSGKGVKVTPSGININSDLSFGSNNATTLKTASFDNQSASLSSSFLRAVYVSGGDLYFNNGSGTAVQLTSGSSINVGSVQGISGLASPASATFSTPYFTFKSASTTYGKTAHSDLDLYEFTAGVTNKITLKTPTSLAASYSLTLPATTPAALAYVSMSSSGTLATASADDICAAATSTGTGSLASTMTTANANTIGAKVTTAADTIMGQVTTAGLAATPATLTTYTPTVTPFAGTTSGLSANGSYMRIGHLVYVKILCFWTQATANAGSVDFSLPIAAISQNVLDVPQVVQEGSALNLISMPTPSSTSTVTLDFNRKLAGTNTNFASGSFITCSLQFWYFV